MPGYEPEQEWTQWAACARVDPELWFPERGGSPKSAIKVCGRCEVRLQCLDAALSRPEDFGVWGGLTYRQRLRLPRRARRRGPVPGQIARDRRSTAA